MANYKDVISVQELLRKAGYGSGQEIQKVWYQGEVYGLNIPFENPEVTIEVQYDKPKLW